MVPFIRLPFKHHVKKGACPFPLAEVPALATALAAALTTSFCYTPPGPFWSFEREVRQFDFKQQEKGGPCWKRDTIKLNYPMILGARATSFPCPEVHRTDNSELDGLTCLVGSRRALLSLAFFFFESPRPFPSPLKLYHPPAPPNCFLPCPKSQARAVQKAGCWQGGSS